MISSFARIDLPERPREFQRIALEPGFPLLDRSGSNSRLLRAWLGRFVAEPEWVDSQTVQFYLNDDQGRRIEPRRIRPVSVSDLQVRLRHETTALREKLSQIKPRGRTEQTIASLVRDRFDALLSDPSQCCADGAFFQYQDSQNQLRLVWCWGYRRTASALAQPVLCHQPNCRCVYLWRSDDEAKCPKCGVAKPVFRFPWRKTLVLAACILIALAAGGWWYWQSLPRAVLNGQVVWSGFEIPVTGAEVRIESLNRLVRSDKDGRFRMDRLPAGSFDVSVTADGYRPCQKTQTLDRESEINAAIELIGDAVLSGRVVDAESHRPVPNAQVSLDGTSQTIRCDDEGRFRREGFRVGRVMLQINADGYPLSRREITLENTDEQQPDLELNGEAVLIGRVLSVAQEQPHFGATVTLEQCGRTARTDKDGWFVFKNAPAGLQVVIVEAAGFASAQAEKELVAGQQRQLEIKLAGAAKLSGTVVREVDSAPLEIAEVRIVGTKFVAKTDVQGQFQFLGASAGPATIEVLAAGFRTQRIEQVLSEKEPTEFTVKLRGDAVLAGQVTDAVAKQPVPQAEVRLVGTPYQARTDAEGKYRLDGVPSHAAKLDVRAGGFAPQVIELKLAAKEDNTQDVLLMGTATVTGVVLEKWVDKPLAKATVRLNPANQPAVTQTTGEDGTFTWKGLRGGVIHLVEFSADGLASRMEMVDVRTTNEPNPLRIVLSGAGKQSGQIVSALDDSAIEGAIVRLVGTDHQIETPKSGQFQFEMLRVGRTVFEVSAPKYQTRRFEQMVASDSKGLTVALGGDAAIFGEVLDSVTKEPVANADVRLEKSNLKTRTNAKGEYRLGGAFAGPGRVIVAANGYPDVSEGIELKSEQELEADIALTGSASLTGEVFGDDGRPIADAEVRLADSEHRVTTGAKGEFQLNHLRGGSARVSVVAKQFAPKLAVAELKVDEAKSLGRIMLARSLTMRGQVIHSLTEQPIAGADLVVAGVNSKARTDSEGRFQLADLPAKRLLLKIVANGFVREEFWRTPTGEAEPELFCLCPPPAENEVFVVLTWTGIAKDLDAHLFRVTAQGSTTAHVFAERTEDDNLQSLHAAQNGRGPESIRIATSKPGRYEFLVHAPLVDDDMAAHIKRLSQSEATVRVYRPGQTEPSQYIIGRNKSATVWWPFALEVTAPNEIKERVYKSEHYRLSLPEMQIEK